ncbi:hypothetical protein HDU76_008540, partial [Blyttiomyces sp. JEL0837]
MTPIQQRLLLDENNDIDIDDINNIHQHQHSQMHKEDSLPLLLLEEEEGNAYAHAHPQEGDQDTSNDINSHSNEFIMEDHLVKRKPPPIPTDTATDDGHSAVVTVSDLPTSVSTSDSAIQSSSSSTIQQLPLPTTIDSTSIASSSIDSSSSSIVVVDSSTPTPSPTLQSSTTTTLSSSSSLTSFSFDQNAGVQTTPTPIIQPLQTSSTATDDGGPRGAGWISAASSDSASASSSNILSLSVTLLNSGSNGNSLGNNNGAGGVVAANGNSVGADNGVANGNPIAQTQVSIIDGVPTTFVTTFQPIVNPPGGGGNTDSGINIGPTSTSINNGNGNQHGNDATATTGMSTVAIVSAVGGVVISAILIAAFVVARNSRSGYYQQQRNGMGAGAGGRKNARFENGGNNNNDGGDDDFGGNGGVGMGMGEINANAKDQFGGTRDFIGVGAGGSDLQGDMDPSSFYFNHHGHESTPPPLSLVDQRTNAATSPSKGGVSKIKSKDSMGRLWKKGSGGNLSAVVQQSQQSQQSQMSSSKGPSLRLPKFGNGLFVNGASNKNETEIPSQDVDLGSVPVISRVLEDYDSFTDEFNKNVFGGKSGNVTPTRMGGMEKSIGTGSGSGQYDLYPSYDSNHEYDYEYGSGAGSGLDSIGANVEGDLGRSAGAGGRNGSGRGDVGEVRRWQQGLQQQQQRRYGHLNGNGFTRGELPDGGWPFGVDNRDRNSTYSSRISENPSLRSFELAPTTDVGSNNNINMTNTSPTTNKFASPPQSHNGISAVSASGISSTRSRSNVDLDAMFSPLSHFIHANLALTRNHQGVDDDGYDGGSQLTHGGSRSSGSLSYPRGSVYTPTMLSYDEEEEEDLGEVEIDAEVDGVTLDSAEREEGQHGAQGQGQSESQGGDRAGDGS